MHRSGLDSRLEDCCFLISWSSTSGSTKPLVSLHQVMVTADVAAVAWLLNTQIYAVLKTSTNILAYQVTKEHARNLPIGRVVELAAQRSNSKKEGEHTQALYNRVKGRFLTLKMGAITIVCTHLHLHRWLQPVCET